MFITSIYTHFMHIKFDYIYQQKSIVMHTMHIYINNIYIIIIKKESYTHRNEENYET